jgi:secreted trypsin-like serine protease
VVTTVTSYTDARNQALVGQGFDGVVRVSIDNFYGTGVLLYGGAAVLTAAHLFNSSTSSARVFFETASGTTTVSTRQVLVHTAYDASGGNSDLALVWLAAPAPAAAEGESLHASFPEIIRREQANLVRTQSPAFLLVVALRVKDARRVGERRGRGGWP